uniref:Uncharacterized protein n=1 Tax=Anopheles coluzzii TaxID=1518534 RepID=A0A8W7PQI5_ANOCL
MAIHIYIPIDCSTPTVNQILHVRNHHLHIGRERFVVRWTASNITTAPNPHRPLERSLSFRIIRTGRRVWATRMMVVLLLVVMVMMMLMVLLLPSVPPPLPCLPAAGTPFEAERDSFAGWVILFRRLPPGSWCSVWLDEPCRLSECRFEAEPDWWRLRLVVLERFRSAKLLRFPLFGLARLVVLDRIKHSVLSVPPPPPPPNARNAVVLLCTLDRRCRSRAPPAATRLDVLPRTEPASRSGWVALFASACWLGSRVVPLALRLIRNVAVLIDGTGLGGAGGAGSSTAGCPSPSPSPSNVTFSYVCDSPSPSTGSPPGGPCLRLGQRRTADDGELFLRHRLLLLPHQYGRTFPGRGVLLCFLARTARSNALPVGQGTRFALPARAGDDVRLHARPCRRVRLGQLQAKLERRLVDDLQPHLLVQIAHRFRLDARHLLRRHHRHGCCCCARWSGVDCDLASRFGTAAGGAAACSYEPPGAVAAAAAADGDSSSQRCTFPNVLLWLCASDAFRLDSFFGLSPTIVVVVVVVRPTCRFTCLITMVAGLVVRAVWWLVPPLVGPPVPDACWRCCSSFDVDGSTAVVVVAALFPPVSVVSSCFGTEAATGFVCGGPPLPPLPLGFDRSPRTFFFSGTFVRTAVCTITPLLSSGSRTVSVVALWMMVTVFSFRLVRLPSSFALSTCVEKSRASN